MLGNSNEVSKTDNYRCSSPVTNKGCNFFPSMNSTPSIANAASVVAQSKKDRVPGLGRGPGLDSRTSDGKLWKLLKNISNEQPQAEQCNTILRKDGYLAVNNEQAADLLDLHYQNINRLNFSVKDRNIKIRASRIVHGCRSDTHRGTSIFSRDFRVNELETAFVDYCLNKCPGPDGIHGQMIVHLGMSGRQRYLDIISCSWNKGQLLRDCRRATVIPIKKCGKTDGTPESYRPIALTSIACKITEKMVLRRLTFRLHSPNLLPDEQYGFREGHSTTNQLLYLCQRIRDAHNRKPTNHIVVVFLDLSKAFDRDWNNFLVIKLYKMFGIGGKAQPWIYDFLRNRLIRGKFNNFLSKSFSFFQGVPQGSVLSPTLFSFYLLCTESVIKRKYLPAYLKKLALERIGDIPIDAVQVYTDGSRDDYHRSGSGIYIKSQDHNLRIQRRNPDGCSVFRSELIAINEALGFLASLPNGKEIWILSDSRSAIQHLLNWQSVRDNVGVSVLTKLKRLSTSHQIHLQWIPSHIGLAGNEIMDTLAKAGACEVPEPSAPLTFLEIFSKTKYQNKTA
ncbi:probable RNA-directed DNA polymerase from transposon BS [Trichonephila clavipes]|nr:probable RNA-directed DNA polymerase from transposon BS [Trichonephila clavipes]